MGVADRWLWIYFHVSILLSTAAVGYSVARGEFLLAACYFVCPVIYFYKRYEKAKTMRSNRRHQRRDAHCRQRRCRFPDPETPVSLSRNTGVAAHSTTERAG